jgi:osmotically-inducible protein OsmY
MINEELRLAVADELRWDPRIDGSTVAVSADGGTVTLRGTVGSFRQKREAKRAAERVYGVTGVINELDVLPESRRDDVDLRADVLQALTLDAQVPVTVDATVRNGVVLLSGTAEQHFQREEAEFVAANVLGVREVANVIILTPPTPNPAEVEDAIVGALQRAAQLEAENVAVTSVNGVVTLTGKVRSWAERDTAVAAAWAAEGVRDVHDQLSVVYLTPDQRG